MRFALSSPFASEEMETKDLCLLAFIAGEEDRSERNKLENENEEEKKEYI